MGQALYRKHRPKKLADVVGQEHVTQTLQNALKQGRISHAYLFTGPRGVGKTSVARILAHEINNLPYVDDATHLDIIEIDAASNRRIDEIRELRDKVYVAPSSAKYKVYIIDEVHMLTREAFNALLKTLEEPPEHVVFILATTDAHKLPETIVSRTQRFSFRPVPKEAVIAHLKDLAKQEKLKVSDEALSLLAEHGEGSFRDSISLLDQAGSHGEAIDETTVRRLLGLPPTEAVDALAEAVVSGAPAPAIASALEALYDQGYQAPAIAKQLGRILRGHVIAGQNDGELQLQLLAKLLEVPVAHDPERFLEITLLAAAPTRQPTVAIAEPAPFIEDSEPESDEAPPPPPPKVSKTPSQPKAPTEKIIIDAEGWTAVLQTLKQRHNTLYGVVRMAQPAFPEPNKILLTCSFAFHQKRLSDAATRQLLASIIKELSGADVTIDCVLDKEAPVPQQPVVKTQRQPDLNTISNIFGGGELLES